MSSKQVFTRSLLQKDADGVGESRQCKPRWDTQLAQLMDKVYEELHEITLSQAKVSLPKDASELC
jgi:hypothetical protein